MKIAILHDADRGLYLVMGGAKSSEFTESALRKKLGSALVGSRLNLTSVLAECRREGAVTLDCDIILEGLEMRKRPAHSQMANRTSAMIESVVKGASPAKVVNDLVEFIPEDVHVKVFVEADAPIFTDENDVLIDPASNGLVQEIVNMVKQMQEQASELSKKTDILKSVDGYEGPLQMIYTRVRNAYGRSNSTSFADYPMVDYPMGLGQF